jgi:hypothetical protein
MKVGKCVIVAYWVLWFDYVACRVGQPPIQIVPVLRIAAERKVHSKYWNRARKLHVYQILRYSYGVSPQ